MLSWAQQQRQALTADTQTLLRDAGKAEVVGAASDVRLVQSDFGRDGFVAYGPDGEVEIGLRYRAEPRIPEHPAERMEGCASPATGLVALSFPDENLIRLVEIASGRVLEDWHVPGAGKIWSDGDGELLVAQPHLGAITRLSLTEGICERIACPDLSPVHAARWGASILVVDQAEPGFWLLSPSGIRSRIRTDQRLLVPTAAIPVCDNTFMMCDRDAHLAARIALNGRVLWCFGLFEDPSSDTDRLANPEHVCALGPNRYAVTDMRNSRIICLDANGACTEILGSTENIGSIDGALWAPTATAPSETGLIIADAGNARLVTRRLGFADRDIWGEPIIASSLLHHPRSVTPIERNLMVADSYHNRVVRLTRTGALVSVIDAACHRRFFWPRNTGLVEGELIVSDSRNRRILRLTEEGESEIKLHANGTLWPLIDPHSIRHAGGNLLLTDTETASIYLTEPSGRLLFVWSSLPPAGVPSMVLDLADVHDAFFDPRHGIWIADTGNDRLVLVDARAVINPGARTSAVVRVLSGLGLRAPRSIEVTPEGLLLVCDSDNHRILILDPYGEILYVHGGRFGHALGHLAHPRLATIYEGRLLVADCINNRILDLPLSSLRSPNGGCSYSSHNSLVAGGLNE